MALDLHWWQQGIIYQIYPRSFQDSNGDGIGDLPGIRQRLDYLQWLGVDAIWISPIFRSPMADFGYDVADYTDIDPIFGTLQDMDTLIAAAHQHNLKVILDFVPNHTSDQHPWFLESRSSRDNPKRDWYIWRDPLPGGGTPNNWLSHFDGKSAWKWDELTQQYYLHTFLAAQPDVNWRNPDLKEAMFNVLRFWLDRGIDGFRVDVAHRIIKDEQLRHNPPNFDWRPDMDPFKALIEKYTRNQPELHPIYREMRSVLDEYPDRMMVGEINVPVSDLMTYYGDNDEFHLPFNFQLIHSPWEAATVRSLVDGYEGLLPADAWPNWVLGNHDQHRFASRTSAAQARVGMMLLLTLRGTPTIYYGDEIGMHDVDIPPELVQDPWEINVPGLGLGRDPERTPMQWDDSPNAGFCLAKVQPWLPIAADYSDINVVAQQNEARSMLSLTQRLIELRRTNSVLLTGSYRSLPAPESVFAYQRSHAEQVYVMALNFTDSSQRWDFSAEFAQGQILLSTHLDRVDESISGAVTLRPDEGVVIVVKD